MFEIKRSNRKTISVEVTREEKVIVRAPLKLSQEEIITFINKHKNWIAKAKIRQRNRCLAHPEPDAEKEKILKMRAKEELPAKVTRYAEIMKLYPKSMRITSAKTRFGSCSAQNSICFSWYLMDYPDEAVDYVVVHELAHIKHKNHGKLFWKQVEAVLPDYKERRKLLK